MPYLGGTAHLLHNEGEGELLSVTNTGFDGYGVTLVLRNKSRVGLNNIRVSAVAYDAAGAAIAWGDELGFFPYYVPAGEYTMGYISFESAGLPADTTFTFKITAWEEAAGRRVGILDLAVQEAEFTESQIVGRLRNTHAGMVSGPIRVAVACLDPESNITEWISIFSDASPLKPNQTLPFHFDLNRGLNCERFLVAARGFEPDTF